MNGIIVMQNVLVFSSYMLEYLEMNRHDVYNTLLNAFAKVKGRYQDRAKTAKYSQLMNVREEYIWFKYYSVNCFVVVVVAFLNKFHLLFVEGKILHKTQRSYKNLSKLQVFG